LQGRPVLVEVGRRLGQGGIGNERGILQCEQEQRSGWQCQLIAHGQRLVDAGRPPASGSLAWYIEASYVGDFPALAVARARACRRPTNGTQHAGAPIR
ncbi:MAG: hypothetical protein ACXVSE_13995, partial [Solirubrobacteraceae bacterium]